MCLHCEQELEFTKEQLDLLFVRKSIVLPSQEEQEEREEFDEQEEQEDLDDQEEPGEAGGQFIPPESSMDVSLSPFSSLELDAVDIGAPLSEQEKLAKEAEARRKKREKKELEESKRNLLERLNSDEVIDADYLLFNKAYARCLIREHLMSLKQQHRWTFGYLDEDSKERNVNRQQQDFNATLIGNDSPNGSVRYVDVAGALGPITKDEEDGTPNPFSEFDEQRLSNVVNELLPAFESMLRYRNTSLKVKEIEIMNELQVMGEGGLKSTKKDELNSNLEEIVELGVDDLWGKVEAKRMMQSEYGQLPGQLYTPQPYQLPLRVSAPPRVGKSATALLMASFAKRFGMVSMYSVFPNKIAPISEMSKKLHRLGWRGQTVMTDVVEEAKKAEQGKPATADTLRIPGVPNAVKKEQKHTRMRFEWMTIDELIPTGTEDSTVFGNRGKIADLVLYSSTQTADCMKMGAAVATWRKTKRVVFHIRDEAQSLAQGIDNKIVPSHSDYVPPPQTLQFLRYYYGNLFGLNCLVTATLFPTFLEEDLWGFLGTTGQNARAGLALSASVSQIKSTLGFNYLPKVLPAIKPYVSDGYIGVSHLEAWKYNTSAESVLFRNKSTGNEQLIKYTVNGETKEIYVFSGVEEGGVAELQYGASHNGVAIDGTSKPVEATFAFQQEAELQNELRKERKKSKKKITIKQQEEDAKAQKIYDERMAKGKEALKILGGKDYAKLAYAGITGQRTASQGALYADGGGSGDGADGATSPSSNSSSSSSNDPSYTPSGNTDLNPQQALQLQEMHYNNDKFAIDAHFKDWLENASEGTIYSYKGEGQTNISASTKDVLVPMYLGALNSKVKDEQMISFIEHFGVLAHNRTKKARRTGQRGQTIATANDSKTSSNEYGVAFLLYQSVLKTREDFKNATSNVAIGKPPMRFHDDTEIDDDDGVLQGAGWKPGEGASSTPSFVLTAFIYDPNHGRNLSTDAQSEEMNAAPAFQVVRFTNAESAITACWNDNSVSKIAILGYGMLSAGLTVQTVFPSPLDPSQIMARTRGERRQKIENNVETYNRIYCAKHLALATTTTSTLDKQLQLAGRTFAELKGYAAPLGWKIQVLGVKSIVDTLTNYSEMEELLADINTPKSLLEQRKRVNGEEEEEDKEEEARIEEVPMSDAMSDAGSDSTPSRAAANAASLAAAFPVVRKLTLAEALKESFDATLVSTNDLGSLGKVGIRRGEFSSILGLTAEVAARRAKAATEARKKAKESNIKSKKKKDELARKELAKALRSETSPEEDATAMRETVEGLVAVVDEMDSEMNTDDETYQENKEIFDLAKSMMREGRMQKRGRENDDQSDQPSQPAAASAESLPQPSQPARAGNPGKRRAQNELQDDKKDDPGKKRRVVIDLGASLAAALRAHPHLPNLISTSEGKKLRVLCHLVQYW